MEQSRYKNGQLRSEMQGNILYYYFLNDRIKAYGEYVNGVIEGEWTFNRESGQLWQVGSFRNGMKNGGWIRYDRSRAVEYDKVLKDGKAVRPRK